MSYSPSSTSSSSKPSPRSSPEHKASKKTPSPVDAAKKQHELQTNALAWKKHRIETDNTGQFKTGTEKRQEGMKQKRSSLLEQIRQEREARKAKLEKGKDRTPDPKPDAARVGQKRARPAHNDDEHEGGNSLERVAKKARRDIAQKTNLRPPEPPREDRRSAITARRRARNPRAVARITRKTSSADDEDDDKRFRQCLRDIGAVSEESADENSVLGTVPLPKKKGAQAKGDQSATTQAAAKTRMDASRKEGAAHRGTRAPVPQSTVAVESCTISRSSTKVDNGLTKRLSTPNTKKRKNDEVDSEGRVPKKLKVLDESREPQTGSSAKRNTSPISAPDRKPKLMPRSQNSLSSNPVYKGTAGIDSGKGRRNNGSSVRPERDNAKGQPKPMLPWSKTNRTRELPKPEAYGSQQSSKRKLGDSATGTRNPTKQTRV